MADLLTKDTIKLQIQKFQAEIKMYDKMIQYNQAKMEELKTEAETKKKVFTTEPETKKRKSTSDPNQNSSKKKKLIHTLLLEPQEPQEDLNLENEEEEEGGPNMSGWSEFKKRAWDNKHRNINNFLHYFKPDGEETRSGKWTVEENNFFVDKINENGGKVKLWGEFSREIPGRTGAQCLYNYHALLKKQKVPQE
jgi:hypothetical protein